MPEDRWSSLLEINLSSEERINDELLHKDLLRENGRIVCVSSMSGIAGNSGQTNYATSKAGVIGMVEALAPQLAKRGATINAVAPGFIETQMTDAMPIAIREAGRRMNSMSQGGLPVDVAETIAWFASPASSGVNGNVVRVCGQSLLGSLMATRTLDSPPSILPLYARAAAPLIPGASLLPFVPGRAAEVPDTELVLGGVRPDPDAVAAYAKVCGFSLRDTLPPTYPHVLAFPLHMALMADGGFPFGAVGLVHVENRIVQHRPLGDRRGAEADRPPDAPCSRTNAARPSRSRPRPGPAARRPGSRPAPSCTAARPRNSPPTGRKPTHIVGNRPIGRRRRWGWARPGSSAATSGGATARCRGTGTRSTCTR